MFHMLSQKSYIRTLIIPTYTLLPVFITAFFAISRDNEIIKCLHNGDNNVKIYLILSLFMRFQKSINLVCSMCDNRVTYIDHYCTYTIRNLLIK